MSSSGAPAKSPRRHQRHDTLCKRCRMTETPQCPDVPWHGRQDDYRKVGGWGVGRSGKSFRFVLFRKFSQVNKVIQVSPPVLLFSPPQPPYHSQGGLIGTLRISPQARKGHNPSLGPTDTRICIRLHESLHKNLHNLVAAVIVFVVAVVVVVVVVR